jgi:A/G-specific adenine glycosylase
MLDNIVDPLLKWYDKNARVLPWREEITPYRVWVSEIMLQQTRVEAAKPFFERFIKELPMIQDLAKCEEDKLLKLWEGLGYYNRVRNMQIAARTIMEQFSGQVPKVYEQILELKGIGSYTAGAISSIAYNIPVPAVDGNVLRVISRITASYEDILKASVKKKIEEEIKTIIPVDRPGVFNQALMELGAMICIPNGMAKCELCPLGYLCQANKMGIVQELPKKAPKKARRIEEKTILVIQEGEQVAIQKRPVRGLLAGLYEFPNIEGHYSQEEVLKHLKDNHLSPIRIQELPTSKHIFSHIEWHMIGYVIKVEELIQDKESMFQFINVKKVEEEYVIPTAFEEYTKYMGIKLGQEKYSNMDRKEL